VANLVHFSSHAHLVHKVPLPLLTSYDMMNEYTSTEEEERIVWCIFETENKD
jgi:hypothetical protein